MGECHYQFGNFDAIVTACATVKILKQAGINPKRFALDWASAAEAPLYVELITKFIQKIKTLGHLGLNEGKTREEMEFNLAAARAAVESVRLRTRIAKTVQDMRKINDYSPSVVESKIAEKLDAVIIREIQKHETAMQASQNSKEVKF